MKFGKALKDRSVDAWSEHYMSYKRLKRIIKKIIVQQKEREEAYINQPINQSVNQSTSQSVNQSYSPSGDGSIANELAALKIGSPMLTRTHSQSSNQSTNQSTNQSINQSISKFLTSDARQEFIAELNKDINRINQFFDSMIDKLDREYWRIASTINQSNTPSMNQSINQSVNQTPTNQPSGLSHHFDYRSSYQTNYPSNDQSLNQSTNQSINHSTMASPSHSIPLSGQSTQSINQSVSQPISQFNHSSPLAALPNIRQSISISRPINQSSSLTNQSINPFRSAPLLKPIQSHNHSINQSCDQLLNLYRDYLNLLAFSYLNQEGFRKIVKKYDKYCSDTSIDQSINELNDQSTNQTINQSINHPYGNPDRDHYTNDDQPTYQSNESFDDQSISPSLSFNQSLPTSQSFSNDPSTSNPANLTPRSINQLLHPDSFMIRLSNEEFVIGRAEIESKLEAVESSALRAFVARGEDATAARARLRLIQRDVESSNQSVNQSNNDRNAHPYLFFALAILVTCLLSSLPLLPIAETAAHKCLVLLAVVTVLFVTEAVPFFVTALMIPFFVVVMKILRDDDGNVLNASVASKQAFGLMFNESVAMILGSFALAGAWSKCRFELRLTALLQRRFGHQPRLFMLMLMLLSAAMSMFISNVAACILLSTLLLPILRDLSRSDPYARCLLLALAFACNVGGMMSPLASPENAIVLGSLEGSNRRHSIRWLTWMRLSVPLGFLCIVVIWSYLCYALLRNTPKLPNIPPLFLSNDLLRLKKQDIFVLSVTVFSFGLWCSSTLTHQLFGGMSAIALIPLIAFTATGILGVNQVRGFSWHLILLIAGGSVLGEAVTNSELLPLLIEPCLPFLSHQPVWVVMFVIMVCVLMFTSFVPHIVAALILTPPVLALGAQIHHTHSCVLSFVFMLHCTMTLPISTFPNVSVWMIEDDFQRPFLTARDFVKHGFIVSVICLVIMATLGYVQMRWVLGKSIF